MGSGYYSLPLKATALIKKRDSEKVTIKKSIGDHLHLIITSYFGECYFDASFGSVIWDVDFNNVDSDNKLITIIEDSLYDSLKKHEPRLEKLYVKTQVYQEKQVVEGGINRIKKRVTIDIKAIVKKTNEAFLFNESFYIGPIS